MTSARYHSVDHPLSAGGQNPRAEERGGLLASLIDGSGVGVRVLRVAPS